MRNATDFFPQQAASHLALRLALHRRLLVAVKRVLPSYLQEHCQTCWLNQRHQLVLQVGGQEYAAQIRFFLLAILEAARKTAGEEVAQVLIRTAIPALASAPATALASPAAAQLIAQEAGAASVPEIGEALSRLAASMSAVAEKPVKGVPGRTP